MNTNDADDTLTETSWATTMLSLAEVDALLALASCAPSSSDLFARTIHASEAAASQIRQRLLSRGLVIRVSAATPPHDTLLVLSTAGRVLATDLIRRRADRADHNCCA